MQACVRDESGILFFYFVERVTLSVAIFFCEVPKGEARWQKRYSGRPDRHALGFVLRYTLKTGTQDDTQPNRHGWNAQIIRSILFVNRHHFTAQINLYLRSVFEA